MELFKAMNLQNNIQDTAAAMIDSEVGRNPGLNPFRDTMLNWLKKYMTWDAMVPELTKLYTSTFTDEELKQMAAFYGSPAGKKSLEKLPELMQRTAMIGASLAQPHSDELKAAMTARSEELKKEQMAAGAGAPGGPGGQPGAPGAPREAASGPAQAAGAEAVTVKAGKCEGRLERAALFLCANRARPTSSPGAPPKASSGSCPAACR